MSFPEDGHIVAEMHPFFAEMYLVNCQKLFSMHRQRHREGQHIENSFLWSQSKTFDYLKRDTKNQERSWLFCIKIINIRSLGITY